MNKQKNTKRNIKCMKLVKKCINIHIIQTSFMYILKISATTYILKLVLK